VHSDAMSGGPGAVTPRAMQVPTMRLAQPQHLIGARPLGGSVTVAAHPQAAGSVTAPVASYTSLTPRQAPPVTTSMVYPGPVPTATSMTVPMAVAANMIVAPPAQAPVSTGTEGLPDPVAIETQRGQYVKSLDEQLKQGADVLNKQLKQQQEYLLRMGDQQKRQFGLQVDQNIKHQELELVQQHNQQLLMLQQAAQQQKVALEQQANALLIEYNQKKANEELAAQMFQFESAATEAHRKYQEEIQSLQQHRAIGAHQLAAQGEALAHQASISNMQAVQAQQVASRTSASLSCPMPSVRPVTSYVPQVPVPTHVSVTPPTSYLPPAQPGYALPSGPMTTAMFPSAYAASGTSTPRLH